MSEHLVGPASRGYSTTVVTSWGRETYQVLLNETDKGWLARIVTLPNRMWAQPGGREAVKFHAATMQEAEAAAVRFIEDECIRTCRRMAPPSEFVNDQPPRKENELNAAQPAPRIAQRILVRFGTKAPDRPGVTGNLSETGMFIITDQPAPVGARVLIDLRTPEGPVVLGGQVVWSREWKQAGRSLGFGVRLTERPPEYFRQLRSQD